jgi:hypothetical protein
LEQIWCVISPLLWYWRQVEGPFEILKNGEDGVKVRVARSAGEADYDANGEGNVRPDVGGVEELASAHTVIGHIWRAEKRSPSGARVVRKVGEAIRLGKQSS